jgi:hypothetical protein
MVDFCPFFSGGFFNNTVYLLLIFAAIRHRSPMTAPDGASPLAFLHGRTPSSTNVTCSQLADCPWDHKAVAELRTRLSEEGLSDENLNTTLSPDYRYTVFTAGGRLCDLRLLMENFSFDNPQAESQILLIEYIDPEPAHDEAEMLKNQICAALTPEARYRWVGTRGRSGDSYAGVDPVWAVTVALGIAPLSTSKKEDSLAANSTDPAPADTEANVS